MEQAARDWGGCWSGGLTACHSEPVRVVHFAFRISNWQHIRQAWGDALAAEASGIVESHVRDGLAQSGGALHIDPHGCVSLTISGAHVAGAGTLAERCRVWVDVLCASFLIEPVMTSAGPLCLWLTGSWEILGDEDSPPVGNGASLLRFLGEPAQEDPVWREAYRRDMAVVAAILADWRPAAAHGDVSSRLALQWQPVRDGRDEASLLYYEAQLSLVDANGGSVSSHETMRALERLGFIRVLDHHIVMQVIAELERDPDVVLGVNISTQSAIPDDWWDEVERHLRLDPWIARRLVIEITETAIISDISQAVGFVSRMRRLGVRLALDHFGTGFASIRQLLALSPDIVKIDRFFLGQARRSANAEAMFRQIVRLAATFGATTIVDGVESEAQAALALDVGADAQQGSFWGGPRRSRSWVTASWSWDREAGSTTALRSPVRWLGEGRRT